MMVYYYAHFTDVDIVTPFLWQVTDTPYLCQKWDVKLVFTTSSPHSLAGLFEEVSWMYKSPDYPRPHESKVYDPLPPAYAETTPLNLPSLRLPPPWESISWVLRKHLLIFSAPALHWGFLPLYWGTPGGYKDTSIELRLPSLMNLEFSGYQTCPWLWQSEAEWKDSPLSDYEFFCSLAPKRCWCFPDMDKVFQWH